MDTQDTAAIIDRDFAENPELTARYNKKLSIIIPFRKREEHLKAFIPHIIKYFNHDKLDRHITYSLHIVEQQRAGPFNRGKLLNCGFDISRDNDYFCFHDIDYLPIWADYSYCPNPARLIWHGLVLKEDYNHFFGAVILFNKVDFLKVNGFSNKYWGWGHEDLELKCRCDLNQLIITKRDGSFISLVHKHSGFDQNQRPTAEALQTAELFNSRQPKLAELIPQDGINTLDYKLLRSENYKLGDHILKNVFHHWVEI
jgi:hypothetical protein